MDLSGSANRCGSHLRELAVASGTIVHEGVEGFGQWAPGMLPTNATDPEDLPAFGQTSHETLANLSSAYTTALSAYEAKRAAAARARRALAGHTR